MTNTSVFKAFVAGGQGAQKSVLKNRLARKIVHACIRAQKAPDLQSGGKKTADFVKYMQQAVNIVAESRNMMPLGTTASYSMDGVGTKVSSGEISAKGWKPEKKRIISIAKYTAAGIAMYLIGKYVNIGTDFMDYLAMNYMKLCGAAILVLKSSWQRPHC